MHNRELVMIIVVMGVSGSGKTTIGKMLADAIRCPFLEGDSLHSKENIEKMSHGIPLTDSDRAPWLTAIRTHILKSPSSTGRILSSHAQLWSSSIGKFSPTEFRSHGFI